MSWVFLDGAKFETTDTYNHMAFDGKDMWVTATNGKVKVYSYWGEDAETETEIDVSSNISDAQHIVKVYDEMFVFNAAASRFIKIDITSQTVVGTIDNAIASDCIPEYGNFKIWFVSTEVDNKQQLFYYDLNTTLWSTPVDIPGRHQEKKRIIKWGRDGWVYVNLLNDNGLAKFNSSNGAYSSTTLTNRLPQAIYVNDDREIIVAGFTGMVSSVNQTTDVSTNIAGVNVETESIVDDGTYLWSTEPSATRVTKGTYTDNAITMIASNVTTQEIHTDVFFDYGFALNNENVVSVTSVKEGATVLVEDTDYTFGIDETFGEQRMIILSTAPNITGDEPLSITVDYNYTTDVKDFNIIGFTDVTFKQVEITPEITHEYWTGSAISSKIELQRVVLMADQAIYFGYNLSDSWTLPELRTYNLEILGTAMVGTGPERYYGETV